MYPPAITPSVFDAPNPVACVLFVLRSVISVQEVPFQDSLYAVLEFPPAAIALVLVPKEPATVLA